MSEIIDFEKTEDPNNQTEYLLGVRVPRGETIEHIELRFSISVSPDDALKFARESYLEADIITVRHPTTQEVKAYYLK